MTHKIVAAVTRVVAATPPKVGRAVIMALTAEGTKRDKVEAAWRPLITFLDHELNQNFPIKSGSPYVETYYPRMANGFTSRTQLIIQLKGAEKLECLIRLDWNDVWLGKIGWSIFGSTTHAGNFYSRLEKKEIESAMTKCLDQMGAALVKLKKSWQDQLKSRFIATLNNYAFSTLEESIMTHKIVAAVSKVVAAMPPKVGKAVLKALVAPDATKENIEQAWSPLVSFIQSELSQNFKLASSPKVFTNFASPSNRFQTSTAVEFKVRGVKRDFSCSVGIIHTNRDTAITRWRLIVNGNTISSGGSNGVSLSTADAAVDRAMDELGRLLIEMKNDGETKVVAAAGDLPKDWESEDGSMSAKDATNIADALTKASSLKCSPRDVADWYDGSGTGGNCEKAAIKVMGKKTWAHYSAVARSFDALMYKLGLGKDKNSGGVDISKSYD